ncbi:MAG TPA: NepR family anti-sigma factor [Rhizomicrobium sp.]|nr:NepR family anti-sigma factor [Rhizomicrobium sp.]
MANDQKSDLEKARLVRARQRAIGRELRRMYDNVAKEPVPDDFLELLHKIDEMGSEGGKKGS